jgi:hypothetical protein
MVDPLPSVAFTGTNSAMWPGGQWRKRERLPHTSVRPIVRQALEVDIRNAVAAAAEKLDVPLKVIFEQGTWHEYTELEDDKDHLVIEFTSKSFLWVKKLPQFPKTTQARWEGGPRDGEIVLASNGDIVWDGPLGVLVQDHLIRWRDVGDGTRLAWAKMSSEERAEYRADIEADAEVTVSHDVELTPAYEPEPEVELRGRYDIPSPMLPIYDEDDADAEAERKRRKREEIARAYGAPATVMLSPTRPEFPKHGDIWVDTNDMALVLSLHEHFKE